MDIHIHTCGTVISEPEYHPPYTVFHLRSGKKTITVLRKDLFWQKRDMVFLRRGQRAAIRGRCLPGENRILAQRIRLTRIVPESDGRSKNPDPAYE